ncbi:ABC-2 transporter permease [Clostridium tetanomorphum]|uniref:ABC-2 transporter permease n=1 Tax=Clostridium tetanomorphum TaxID=1553 RepID=UPI00311A11A7
MIYKEWRNAKWISLLILLDLIIFKIINVTSSLNNLKSYKQSILERAAEHSNYSIMNYNLYKKYWFNNSLNEFEPWIFGVIILTIVLAIILFQSERNGSTYSLIASMPFKRSEVIKTKWLTGMLAITLPFIITFVVISVFYFINLKWMIEQPFSLILNWLFINIFTCIAIFSFIFFIETIMGQNISAAIVGSLILTAPSGCLSIINEFIITHIQNPLTYSLIIKEINTISQNILLYTSSKPTFKFDELVIGDNHIQQHYYIYYNYGLKIVVLLFLIGITYLLSIYCYNKNQFEMNGYLVLFKPFEYILKFGVAICLGLLCSAVLGVGYSDGSLLAMYSFLLIGSILGYLVTNKAINYFAK